MARVTVYRYKVYSIGSDQTSVRSRMGTREAIEGVKRATIIEDSGVEIDASLLDPRTDGFTAENFVP